MKLKLCLTLFSVLAIKAFAITWGSPQTISSTPNNADASDIAMDESGQAFSTWENFDGTHEVHQAAVYSTSWGTAQTVSTSGLNAVSPHVSANNGHAIIIGEVFDGTNTTIQAVVYSSGWGTPQVISTTGVDGHNPQVSVNSTGDALATWEEPGTTFDVVKAAYYTASTNTWGSPVTISNTSVQSQAPSIAFSNAGKGIASWSFVSGSDLLIAGASFSSGTWGSPQTLSTANAISTNSKAAINPSGVGIIVWERDNDPLNFDSIQVSHFNGTSFSIPVRVSKANISSNNPDVAINSAGNIVVSWRYSAANVSVGANVFITNVWKGAKVVATENLNSNVRCGIDGSNKAYTVWSATPAAHNLIRVAQYTNSWHAPQTVSSTSLDGDNPVIYVEGSGDAFIAYDSNDGTNFVINAIKGV